MDYFRKDPYVVNGLPSVLEFVDGETGGSQLNALGFANVRFEHEISYVDLFADRFM